MAFRSTVPALLRGVLAPLMLCAAAADAVRLFDPAELPSPTDRLSLLVQFCAS